ncbi:MAG: hypothetical protein J2P23_01775 [Microlunatus sp.]|nr:hypothetical protein [Microlunatus sp.]
MTGDSADDPEERIQSYLDEVLLVASGRPRDVRGLLAEVEAHLRESVDAGLAAGLDRRQATEVALQRFGPPAGVVRGSSAAAYRTMIAQLCEAGLLLVSVLCLAVGVASVPVAVVAMTGRSDLVTGRQSGQPPVDQLTETVRNHLVFGVVGVVTLVSWWLLQLRRRTRPVVLQSWFALTVCGVSTVAVAAIFLTVGLRDLVLHIDSAAGVVGAGDLVVTGATIAVAAALSWLALGRQATRPSHSPPTTQR